jgi:hypothetical protein
MCILQNKQTTDASPTHHTSQMRDFTQDYKHCLASNENAMEVFHNFANKYDWEAINASQHTDYEIVSRSFMAFMLIQLCGHPLGHIVIEKISIHVLSVEDLLALSLMQITCSSHILSIFIDKMIDMGIYLNLDQNEVDQIVNHFRKQLA